MAGKPAKKAARVAARKPPPAAKPKKKVPKTKIKLSPDAEYAELMQKSGVSITALADDDCKSNIRTFFSTQSIALDLALGPGRGIPSGRITEMSGKSHLGKSTLLDHIFAGVQKMGGLAILADTEVSRDRAYTAKLGVDITKLKYLEWDKSAQASMEDVIQAIFKTINYWKEAAPDLPIVIGWDSVGGTATNEELEGEVSDKHMASAAKVLRQACRQLAQPLAGTNIALVLINHTYQKLSGRGGSESYGGEAVRLTTSVRLDLHGITEGNLYKGGPQGELLGKIIGVKVIKNRTGKYGDDVKIAMISGIGVDNTWTVFNALVKSGFITNAGSWHSFGMDGQTHNFQGWNGFAEKMKADPVLFQKLVGLYFTIEKPAVEEPPVGVSVVGAESGGDDADL